MKVLCIKTSEPKGLKRNGDWSEKPPVEFGETYTVVGSEPSWHWPGTTSYQLAERPLIHYYNEQYFSPLSNIDEKEFIREYNKATCE